MSVLNTQDVINEVVMSLRNADILSTTTRNVTTTTTTGTISGATTITIPVSNVKNVRSLTLGSTALAFGSEYTVDIDYNNTCLLTLATTATADYSVQYDYGTDKIFPDYPRNELSLTSFPRIAVTHLDVVSDVGGFGNVNRNVHDISITAYDAKKEDVRTHIYNIRSWIINNQNNLYYLRLIKPSSTGPLVIAGEFEKFKDKIMKQNQDFRALLQYEIN